MIFVSVGTHEQPFNRLIEEVDLLKKDKVIKENVIIQTGYCTYKPAYCTWKKLFSYKEMSINIEKARIVITHGGPSSFIAPLQIGKIPIVVPREKNFKEHINNHQLDFCHEVVKRQKNIILVEDIKELEIIIRDYDEIVRGMKKGIESNNEKFCREFADIVDGLFK